MVRRARAGHHGDGAERGACKREGGLRVRAAGALVRGLSPADPLASALGLHRYAYYVCYSGHRYGTGECDQDRLRADELEDRVVESLLATLARRDLLKEARPPPPPPPASRRRYRVLGGGLDLAPGGHDAALVDEVLRTWQWDT